MTNSTALKLSDFYLDNDEAKTNEQTVSVQDLLKNFGVGDPGKGENFFAGIKANLSVITSEELHKVLQGELSDRYDVEVVEI